MVYEIETKCTSISRILLKGYAEAGALDGEHESFYRRCCQLIEVKKEEDSHPVG
jgi:hypothetical protein